MNRSAGRPVEPCRPTPRGEPGAGARAARHPSLRGVITRSPKRSSPAVPAALALAGALAGFAPAASGMAPAAAPPVRVPIRMRAHKVELPVELGGRTLHLVLDTGMAYEGLLLYDGAKLDSAGRAHAARARIGGAGDGPGSTALVADSVRFRVGGTTFADQRVIALLDSPLRTAPSDGVIGFSLFAHHVVELDYRRMELVLHAPGAFRPGPGWTSVPLEFRDGHLPWLGLEASVRAGDSLALACYVDLASSESVEFLTREGMRFAPPESLADVLLGVGLSGEVHGGRAPIPWVRLGTVRVRDVEAAFTPAKVRSKQPGADAVVGNGLLDRFHCAFDYAAKRLYLEAPEAPSH